MNTAAPTLSVSGGGKPTVGDSLTLTQGTWTPAGAAITDTWSNGAPATTTPTATYILQPSDAGKTIKVSENATDATGSGTAVPSNSIGPIDGPPAIAEALRISGTPTVGDKLTASSTWAGYPPPSVSYVWSDGTKGRTDTLAAADAGRTVSVTVTASNGIGSPGTASATAGPIDAPPTDPAPTITGTAKQGDTLVAISTSTGYPAPAVSFVWSDGTQGATDTLSATDVGKSVTVTATASNGVGPPVSATSASFGPVAPADATATSTTLQAIPSSALTNESVLLIATVTSSDGSRPPSGAVTFKNGAADISGCTNLAVSPKGQSVTVTCTTSFGAANASLTAVFTPASGSNLTASASPVDSYAIGKGSTTTSLDVSPTADAGSSTTFTATVDPPPSDAGPLLPSGSVEFLDGGQPIPSCINQPVANGGATCTVTYQTAGSHRITAAYHGDSNFTGSLSAPQSVSVVAPHKAPRTLTPTMQWTFYYSPTYTRVLALVINGVGGDRVLVLCHGKGCPFSKRGVHVPDPRACPAKASGSCQVHLELTPVFRGRRLQVGAWIRIWITRSGFIGKYYAFTVRPRQGPKIRIGCLAPGVNKPGASC